MRFPIFWYHLPIAVHFTIKAFKNALSWGAWVAQSVKYLTAAQVKISWFLSSSPVSGSVLTAPSLERASDSVSPSLSAPPLLGLTLPPSLSLSQK